jgi:hypothetical protein
MKLDDLTTDELLILRDAMRADYEKRRTFHWVTARASCELLKKVEAALDSVADAQFQKGWKQP